MSLPVPSSVRVRKSSGSEVPMPTVTATTELVKAIESECFSKLAPGSPPA